MVLNSSQQGVVRKVRVSGFYEGVGRAGNMMHTTLLSQIVANKNTYGVYVNGTGSHAMDVSVNQNTYGVAVYSATSPSVQGVFGAGNTIAVYSFSSDGTVITAVSGVNNTMGAAYTFGSNDNTIHNVFQPTGTAGILGTGSRQTLSQVGGDKIDLSSVTNGKITGNWVRGTSTACAVTGGSNPGLVNNTCANQGASNSVQTVGNGTSSLVGALASDDLTNRSDNNAAMSFASISDWTGFDSLFRYWNGGGASPVNCTSGTCVIWDYRLGSSDTRFQNTTYDGVNPNPVFNQQGGNCPAFLNTSLTDNQTVVHTYLANAIEILGNGGNNNGLCEAGETCLYTPNFGYYQGEGDYTQKWCTSTGAVAGATAYAY